MIGGGKIDLMSTGPSEESLKERTAAELERLRETVAELQAREVQHEVEIKELRARLRVAGRRTAQLDPEPVFSLDGLVGDLAHRRVNPCRSTPTPTTSSQG